MECPPIAKKQHHRQTQTLIITHICSSSLLSWRTNFKYRGVRMNLWASSWKQSQKHPVGFWQRASQTHLQFPRYFSFRCIFTRCPHSCLNGAASQCQSDNNQDEFRSSEKSLTSWRRSKDKPLTTAAFTRRTQIRSWLLLKSWNYS